MKYPVEKYRIVVHQHPRYHTTEIIAMSTYAGEVVKGKAICQIGDNYDEQAGTELAVARCAEKIARKRKATGIHLHRLRNGINRVALSCSAKRHERQGNAAKHMFRLVVHKFIVVKISQI